MWFLLSTTVGGCGAHTHTHTEFGQKGEKVEQKTTISGGKSRVEMSWSFQVFLFFVQAQRPWPLTSSLLSACVLGHLGTEAHLLLRLLDKSASFCPQNILHLYPFRTTESHLVSHSDVKASHPNRPLPSTSTGRQPPAHVAVVGSVCEKRRVALNILAGAPTFINLSCQMPSVHPPLAPVFPATVAAIKGSVLWLFDGKSWPGTLCSC